MTFVIAGLVVAALVGLLVKGVPALDEVDEPSPAIDPGIEYGELTVLRVALDGPARAEIAAIDPAPLGELAAALLRLRPAWRQAGADDVGTAIGGELRERFARLASAERTRLVPLDGTHAADVDAPFRARDQLGDRGVVLVVLVVAARASYARAVLGERTLVTVGELGRGDMLAEALETLVRLPASELVGVKVFVRSAPAADIALIYARDELVALTT